MSVTHRTICRATEVAARLKRPEELGIDTLAGIGAMIADVLGWLLFTAAPAVWHSAREAFVEVRAGDLWGLPQTPALGFAALLAYGHADRPVEMFVRRQRLRAHGFGSYGEYVMSPLWRRRAARWYREHGKPPCCVCARLRHQDTFHLHHVDRIRAGGGHEPDRDLVPICHRCHVVVHKVEYALAAWGVTLRASTWLVRHTMLPVRLLKRLLRGLRSVGDGIADNIADELNRDRLEPDHLEPDHLDPDHLGPEHLGPEHGADERDGDHPYDQDRVGAG